MAIAGGALATVGLAGCASELSHTGDEGGATVPAIDEKLLEKLQEIVAKEEIREKIVAYARSMDRIDRELGYSIFAQDSFLDYGDYYQGDGPGFVDITLDFHETVIAHQHHMNNITIEVAGDKAYAETYVDMVMRLPAEDGSLIAQNVHGRYWDEWVNENGEWLLKTRSFARDLGTNITIDPSEDLGSTGGARDKSDYSYTLFAQAQ